MNLMNERRLAMATNDFRSVLASVPRIIHRRASALVPALLVVLLVACKTTPNRAPVEDRGSGVRPAASVVAPSPAKRLSRRTSFAPLTLMTEPSRSRTVELPKVRSREPRTPFSEEYKRRGDSNGSSTRSNAKLRREPVPSVRIKRTGSIAGVAPRRPKIAEARSCLKAPAC